MTALRITVLSGGPSAERSVSIDSGRAIADALRSRGHIVHLSDIGPDNLTALDHPADVIFSALHGAWGEDGQLQGILEDRGLHFVGSGSQTSAITIDKIATKQRVAALGLPTPASELWTRATLETRRQPDVAIPVIVKPVDQGSSVATTIVRAASDFLRAVKLTIDAFDRALVEEFISGDELTVGILGETALPPIIVRPRREFYDFAAKYEDDATEYLFDAGHPPALYENCARMSERVFKDLGGRHLARIDWMIDRDNRPWFLEVNTLPGFTSHSLVPKAAKKIGIEFDELCERLVHRAIGAIMPRMSQRNSSRGSNRRDGQMGMSRRAAVLFLGVLFWGGVVAGVVWGLPRLEPIAKNWSPPRGVRIEWAALPNWVREPNAKHSVLEQLENLTGLMTGDNISDLTLCDRVAANLMNPSRIESYWIQRLNRIEKTTGRDGVGVVRIDAMLREPIGLIAWKDQAYTIDADAVVLPLRCPLAQVDVRRSFIITGVAQPPPRSIGDAWPGDDALAGAKLVRFLNQCVAEGRLPFRDALQAVDVANFGRNVDKFGGRLRIQIYGPESFIHWGEPPGEEFDVDTKAARKIEMLQQFFIKNGQLPASDFIDVRYNDGIRYRGLQSTDR